MVDVIVTTAGRAHIVPIRADPLLADTVLRIISGEDNPNYDKSALALFRSSIKKSEQHVVNFAFAYDFRENQFRLDHMMTFGEVNLEDAVVEFTAINEWANKDGRSVILKWMRDCQLGNTCYVPMKSLVVILDTHNLS